MSGRTAPTRVAVEWAVGHRPDVQAALSSGDEALSLGWQKKKVQKNSCRASLDTSIF